MSYLVEAGMGAWALEALRSRDPVFVQVAQAVAERVLKRRSKVDEARNKWRSSLPRNIGRATASEVGKLFKG